MNTVAQVNLWGSRIGAVLLEEGADHAAFEYDPAFLQSRIEVAPLQMPLSERVYQFPQLASSSFHGLPGLLADSLPDRFGNALIDAWLARQGRSPDSMNAVERLCYTGTRGMGALEFLPVIGPRKSESRRIHVDRLVELASQILTHRKQLDTQLDDPDQESALQDILRVGTSAGGARAKAIIAWNPKTDEVRSGQIAAGGGFEYWLLKFDGVSGNKDKELNDPQGYGLIEYAYSLMAKAAGIEMSECRIMAENGRHHFMTRRFDRLENGDKLHMQSLAALGHFDFNLAGAYSYEQALLIMRQLSLPMPQLEQQFRRMVFNIVARNQDDHVKNIAFLMDRLGRWRLSPAFDLTYSYNPSGAWTASHQMTMNGKRDGFVLEDFKTCAKTASMVRGRAEAILEEVRRVVSEWPRFAGRAGVPVVQRDAIKRTLRLQPFV